MLLNIYLTSRPPFVCQNHRSISCTLRQVLLGGRTREQILLVQNLARLASEQGTLARKDFQCFAVHARANVTNRVVYESYILLNKAHRQGKIFNVLLYTRANETCQGKFARL